MRKEFARLARAIPKLPEQNDPGYPPSSDLKQKVSRLQNELEQYRLRLCEEVEVRWQRGDRKELGDDERRKMEEWAGLMETRRLGWPQDDLTDEEELRQMRVGDSIAGIVGPWRTFPAQLAQCRERRGVALRELSRACSYRVTNSWICPSLFTSPICY